MAFRFMNAAENEHRPARSGTPAAWMTLGLLVALIAGWLFFDIIVTGVLRLALDGLAWSKGTELAIDHLALRGNGTVQAQGVSLKFGPPKHSSSWKSEWIEVRICSLGALAGYLQNKHPRLLREVSLGKTKLLLDRRTGVFDGQKDDPSQGKEQKHHAIPWIHLLPEAFSAGPIDLVVIGNDYRCSAANLYFSLPNRWAGRVAYSEAILDIGPAHHVFSAASAPASWNGKTLQIDRLVLAKELQLDELTLTPQPDRIDFGLRGLVGEGVIRGDGSLGHGQDNRQLSATLVGENLAMQALGQLIKKGEQRASGTIRQGRVTFRGDPDRPLEADSSLRLVADGFRWEGRGWDSLRLAATLTGRVCRLSELSLRQKANTVEAQGESKLPEDWHEAMKAPFTATFHADLDDAGALAALVGSDFAQLSGGLEMEGFVKGAENKANGYCNLVSAGMKIRNLPVDWLKGCLLFEGKKTRLSNLEAWSGKDRVVMQGEFENSTPHNYAATAQFNVANLTKNLSRLGISTASQIGGGAVQGIWQGDGSVNGHSGTFQAKVADWISPWTMAGMSGSFEGSYSPGHLYFSKAEFGAQDLRLRLQMSASPTRMEAKSIVATRNGKTDPLIQGDISLPVNAPALWQSGDLVSNLGMKDPLALQLELHGIKVEELATLLGQKTPCTGMLEGALSAGGTPERPAIHSELKMTKLSLPDSAATTGVAWNFDASDGGATFLIQQEPVKSSPLAIKGVIPFRLTADMGRLRIAETNTPIHAVATFHGVPIGGWMTLLGGWRGLILRDGAIDGSVTLDGTLMQPSVKGDVTLSAREAGLPGLPVLSKLELPIACSLSKAALTQGTALYGTNVVKLNGLVDWSSALAIRLDLAGGDLSFPPVGGLQSRGDAEISFSQQGTNNPTLAGSLLIKQIAGSIRPEALPSVIPPGMVVNQSVATLLSWKCDSPVELDLQAKTAGLLPLVGAKAGETTQIQADLHLHGGRLAPRWSGNIVAKDVLLKLPAGGFLIPEARLQCENNEENLTYTAYGLTRRGYCLLQQNGSVLEPSVEAPAAGNTVADMMLALAAMEQTGAIPLGQTPAWIRQNTLFPLPAVGWIQRRGAENAEGALGCYGRFWGVTFRETAAANPSLPEAAGEPKN